MGQLIDNDEKWQFYKAENCERPSNTELKYLKGIIISGSELSIKNTKKKEDDEKIFKKFLLQKRQGQTINTSGTASERSVSNIGISDTYDIVALAKQAADIVGEEQIPQNEPWIENLAEFIRHVNENFPHIKLVGC